MELTKLLNKLLDKKDLTMSETKLFLETVMKGEVSSSQLASILVALRMKGEKTDEIVGLIQTMRDHMVRVNVTDAIDVCGTGGDGSNSINISTAVSLVIAACGVKVAKHGNRAASSKSGTADVLESLGVNINLSVEQAKEVLEKVGMVFLFAPNFHPATKNLVMVRKELKIRTVFNFLGPFLNPASTKRQLIGVPTIDAASKLIAVGEALGYEHLVIVTSEDGMDEVSTYAPTHVFTLKNKIRKEFVINPKQFGFGKGSKKDIIGGSAEENALSLKNILDGEKGPKRDIILLNSAVALVVAGKVANIPDGIKLAEQVIDSGAAKKVLADLIKETNKYKEQKLHNVLLEIVERKKEDVARLVISSETERSRKKKQQGGMRFFNSLSVARNDISVIAEIKFASPTNPSLGSPKDLLQRAKVYEKAGANMISIITEPHFFKGSVDFVSQVKKVVAIPVLQKDFVIDERQIYQAKGIGSDALLLIARLVDTKTLQHFVEICFAQGIEPVVEINNEEDLEKAIETKTKIIAVNARNLETFAVDVKRACQLMKKIPDKFIKLGFSGINSKEEVEQYKSSGAKGVLVGTSLIKAKNIKSFIRDLRVLPESPSRRAPALRGVRAIGNPSYSVTRKVTNKVKVKICGVRTFESAEAAIDAGADFLGFNFVPTSKRYIDPKDVKEIINKLRTKNLKLKTKYVGVFQNQQIELVNKISEFLNLDFVQLHGEEDDEYLNKMKYPFIKKITMQNKFTIPDSCFIILDRKIQGEGEMVDLVKAKKITKKFPAFFSGGLTPDNVSEVIKKTNPFAVDVASGIETDGKQDVEKIKLFIKNAKGGSL